MVAASKERRSLPCCDSAPRGESSGSDVAYSNRIDKRITGLVVMNTFKLAEPDVPSGTRRRSVGRHAREAGFTETKFAA